MTSRVFIDGEAGTTGLQIRARLADRDDIVLLRIGEAHRKDAAERRRLINEADASTAHRVAEGWTFGFPELTRDHAGEVAAARRVANPGCYSTGAIALLRPLVDAGLLPRDFPVTLNAVSGYSGGGRQLIESYESPAPDASPAPDFFLYGLTLSHKHLPEMQRYAGLQRAPLFVPSVARYRQGMLVSMPLATWALPGQPKATDLHAALAAHYAGSEFVHVMPPADTEAAARLDPQALNGSNDMNLWVFGNEGAGQALLVAQLDNLGKGASGAAVQCLNLMLGLDVRAGLRGAATA